jgi:hypothetical protein
MILGRNTQQWLGLITAFLSTLGTVLVVAFPERFDPTSLTVIFGAIGAFMGVAIAFVANTYTTPVSDPQLVQGTMIRVTDDAGRMVGHTPVPTPEPVAEGEPHE